MGVPGHVIMPSAQSLPDGVFALSLNAQGSKIRRGNMAFQITPAVTGVFRYGYLQDYDTNIGKSLYDRSFDLIFRLVQEDRDGWAPSVALGLQDFGGTGIYGAEYLVASRHFGKGLMVSAGLGWGRLATHGGFDNPLGALSDRFDTRPNDQSGDQTGRVSFDRFFRGDAAFFAGLNWQASEKLRFALEYSSDAMRDEERVIGYEYDSPINLGLSYRFSENAQIDLAWLSGSTASLGYSMILDPRRSAAPSGHEPGPPAVAYGTAASWKGATKDSATSQRLAQALGNQGLRLEGLRVDGTTAEVAISNRIWPTTAQGWGRTMRVLTAQLPPEVETLHLQGYSRGIAVRRITLTRQDLEELEYAPDGDWRIWSRAQSQDAALLPDPRFDNRQTASLQLLPYFEPAFFDPDNPLRFDVGAQVQGEWSPWRGVYFSGGIRQKVIGNLNESQRLSNSVLNHVRSDSALYYQKDGPRLPWATVEWLGRPGTNLYSRMSAGLLEQMYGGVSGEVLWAPVENRLSLGLEINHVQKRDYDGLGFQDYQVTTGHASLYYQMEGGYSAQIDAGRYLAGDWGSTLMLNRRFGNGVEVGAFFTLTDVGFDKFGEGAFDKGISITLPLTTLTGHPSRTKTSMTIRPILRDGGAKLGLRNRLYAVTRDDRAAAAGEGWSRFWR